MLVIKAKYTHELLVRLSSGYDFLYDGIADDSMISDKDIAYKWMKELGIKRFCYAEDNVEGIKLARTYHDGAFDSFQKEIIF